MSTLAQYLRHATQFGADCVLPTALASRDLSSRELVELKVGLLEIAASHRKAKKPPSWSDDVRKPDEKNVLALHAEGLTPTEIEYHTKLSTTVIQKALDTLPAPGEYDRKRSTTDVSGWDAEIKAGGGASEAEVVSGPSVHAGSSVQFSQDSQKTGSGLHSPAARQKAAETRARRQAQKDEDIVRLRRERKMVPGGIAKVLKVGEQRVRHVLRAEGLL